MDGEKKVKIFREDVAVKAKVFTIGGFSAHADQKGLLEWVGHFASSHPRVFVVHGELSSSRALSEKIGEVYSLDTGKGTRDKQQKHHAEHQVAGIEESPPGWAG